MGTFLIHTDFMDAYSTVYIVKLGNVSQNLFLSTIYSTAHAELKRERRVRALLLASFNV